MSRNRKEILSAEFREEAIRASEETYIDIYNKYKGKSPFLIMLKFYRGHYGKLLLSLLFFGIKTSPTWVVPIITADIIDVATLRPEGAGLKILIDLLCAGLAIAVNIPTHMLYVKYFSEVNRSMEAGLRGAMVRKLQHLSISFHKDFSSGKIQQKVMRDVESVADFCSGVLTTAGRVFCDMSVMLAVVLSRNVYVFLMFLVSIPLAIFLRQGFKKKMQSASHSFRRELEDTASAVLDMEEMISVTRAHALEDVEVDKLTAEVTSVARSGFRLDKVQSLFGSVSWSTFTFLQAVCLSFTAFLALRGQISVGDITLYQTYFTALVGYVSSIISLLPTIARGEESISSIGEILCAYDTEQNDDKIKLPSLRGEYEFRDVCFRYDEETKVLSGLSMKVNPGETVALVGESGAGKTTLINLVIGFDKPTGGQFLIDGVPAENLDMRAYRQHISVVPQNSILFSGSIRDNITYGLDNISEERLSEVIRAARLENVIEKLPNGLDTRVGEHGGKLSGGQRQRISIARAIIRNPDVIIFDEATSALDSVTERQIQEALDELTKNRTTFIVAHRLSTIKNADKIAVLRDGRCVEFGTYRELMEKKGEFYNYKQMQS